MAFLTTEQLLLRKHLTSWRSFNVYFLDQDTLIYANQVKKIVKCYTSESENIIAFFVETQEKQKLMICWKPVSQPHCLAMLHQLRHSEEINLDILNNSCTVDSY